MPLHAPLAGALLSACFLTGCASTSDYRPDSDPVAQWLAAEHPQALNVYLAERQSANEEDTFPWRAALTTGVTVLAYQNPVLGLSSNASAFLTMTGAPHLLGGEQPSDEQGSATQWVAMMMSMQGSQHLQARIAELEQQLESRLAHLDQRIIDEMDDADIPGAEHLALTERLGNPLTSTLREIPDMPLLKPLSIDPPDDKDGPTDHWDLYETLSGQRVTASR